ncbi:MAG TPA: filamentous hemagglutinin N-terminal domain-containing protein [Halomicronema sp.]
MTPTTSLLPRFVLTFLLSLLFSPTNTTAQIIPDNSLGTENSTVNPAIINGFPVNQISGGAVRGVNLFHSFSEFNIPENTGAYFANPTGIANIFSRITGPNSSNISGVLGVAGNANLFLLNPRGIIFGSNARLDVRGSFLASSADSIVFDNGYLFSSSNPTSLPLLNVNIPIGLNFRENAGAIVNSSGVSQNIQGTEIPVGLAVQPGQTLALVGGDVTFNNGFASAFSGNLLLGSVASPGFVGFGLTPTGLTLNYAGIQNFGNIEFNGLSSATTTGPGGGAISVNAGKIILRDLSSLTSDTLGDLDGRDIKIETRQLQILDKAFISTLTLGAGKAGNLEINGTDSIEIIGPGFEDYKRIYLEGSIGGIPKISERQGGLLFGSAGTGKAGNISLNTRQLSLQNGAAIVNTNLGISPGGNIEIKASEFVDLNASGIFSPTFNQGNAGNITIETGKLSVSNGAVISPATFSSGNAGILIINATDSVLISKIREDSPVATGISSNSIGGTGNAGDIEMNTRSLRIEEGASLTSSSGLITRDSLINVGGQGANITINALDKVEIISSNTGDSKIARSLLGTGTTTNSNSGELTVNTRQLIVKGGGGIGASTIGSGSGGNLFINASESVEISGTTADKAFSSSIISASGDVLYQTAYQLPPPTGAAGNLNINTPQLIVRDGGAVSVASFGAGNAGTLNINAERILLDNAGKIDATTGSGAGGNINLNSLDMRLRRNSRISSDAGSSGGGNITLNSDILVAFPSENSDITANAATGAGGKVTVNIANIFGTSGITREQVRLNLGLSEAEFAALQVNPTTLLQSSDIAAISQSAGPSLQGTVTFSTAGVNPIQGLIELPQNVVDPAALVAANPCIQRGDSEFVVTGKGGIPANPQDTLSSHSAKFNWVEPVLEFSNPNPVNNTISNSQPLAPNSSLSASIIPAQGWVMNTKGEVSLVAYNVGNSMRNLSPNYTCVKR